MDGLNLFDNIAVAGIIIGVIVVVIQWVKQLLEKTSWVWVRKMPGEVWFLVSVVLGIAASLILNYNAISEATGGAIAIPSTLGKVATGIGMGLSSKVTHAVATPIAAKLKEVKEVAKINTETLGNGCVTGTPVVSPVPIAPKLEDEVILMKFTDSKPDAVLINGKVYKLDKGES